MENCLNSNKKEGGREDKCCYWGNKSKGKYY